MNKDKQPLPSRIALLEAAQRESERIKGDPNVIAVGYGLRIKDGKPLFEVCLHYYVKEKLVTDKAIKEKGSAPVPHEAHGYPTDVIEQQVNAPHQCPTDNGMPAGERGGRKENPLVGGTSSTVLSDWHSFPTGYGTLGGICFDTATGDAMALSNAHVWGQEIGKDVIQPWLPTDEYLEAAVKLLACGPVVSYILDTTVPSPLTAGLAAAAAAAWIAAAASDMEDPSRWGQRTGPAPAGPNRTFAERVRIAATIPDFPFAGSPYSTETFWKYTRETDAGSSDKEETKIRHNEHVLLDKRVWTEKETYGDGERVHICAELLTERAVRAEDYFVVAQCFPQDAAQEVRQRVLIPGDCKKFILPHTDDCIHGFGKHQPTAKAIFPLHIGELTFESSGPGEFLKLGDGNGVTALRLPESDLIVRMPARGDVTIEVMQSHIPVTAKAYNAKGDLVATAIGNPRGNRMERLHLQGQGITSVVISGGGRGTASIASVAANHLIGVCASNAEKQPIRHALAYTYVTTNPAAGSHKQRFTYTGSLDLRLNETKGKWGIVLFVQTVNNVPPGTDPVVAAQTIGGITVSQNMMLMGDPLTCGVVMALDHIFDVI